MNDSHIDGLSNDSKSSTPLIYGHRGARGEMPENSLEGLQHLAKIGARAVEIDVQNTCDGITIVWHDPNLATDMVRTASGEWLSTDSILVNATPYKDLVRYDIGTLKQGSEHATRFPQQAQLDQIHIPTLEAVCRWASTLPDLTLNIEVKSYADQTDLGDSPAVLAQSVLSLTQEFGLVPQTIVSSFDWRVLSALQRLAPDLKRGYLSYMDRTDPPMQPNIWDGSEWMDGIRLANHGGHLPQAIAENGGSVWAPYFEDLNPDDLALAQKLGLKVNVWTVNTTADMKRMADMGVDGIITDYPSKALALLQPTPTATNAHD